MHPIPITRGASRWSPAPRPARARSTSSARPSDLLFKNNLAALSALEGQTTLYDGMERLGLAVNGADNASSAATAIGELQQALQTYSASPSNRNLAENAVDAARQVVRTLNSGTQAIQSFRADMDSEIASRRQRAQRSARPVQGRQHRHRLRHAQRPRRLRFARPPRRAAEADLRASSAISTFTRVGQRHGHHDQGRRDAVRDHSAHRHLPAADRLRGRARSAIPSISTAYRCTAAAAATPILPARSPAWSNCATASPARCRASSTRSRAAWSPRLPRPTVPADRCRRAPASSPGPALRQFPLPARSSTDWPARSRSTPPSIPRPAATPICCATAAPTAPATSTTPVAAHPMPTC